MEKEAGGRRVVVSRWKICDEQECPFRLPLVRLEREMHRWGRLLDWQFEARAEGVYSGLESAIRGEGK